MYFVNFILTNLLHISWFSICQFFIFILVSFTIHHHFIIYSALWTVLFHRPSIVYFWYPLQCPDGVFNIYFEFSCLTVFFFSFCINFCVQLNMDMKPTLLYLDESFTFTRLSHCLALVEAGVENCWFVHRYRCRQRRTSRTNSAS